LFTSCENLLAFPFGIKQFSSVQFSSVLTTFQRKEKGLEYEKLMAKGGLAAVIKANRKKEEKKQAGKRKQSSSIPDNSESSSTRQMKRFITSFDFSQSQDSYSSDGPGAMFEEKEDWGVGG
jgi:hypothetical protein